MRTEREIASVALALIDCRESDLSTDERRLVARLGAEASDADPVTVRRSADAIRRGRDPLGDAFMTIRSPDSRRDQGAVYTPARIVGSMIRWLGDQGAVSRIVDPGAGSGRFVLAAAVRFSDAELVAAEMDPLAALVLRANIAAVGATARTRIHVGDYRRLKLARVKGPTAFIGNPPYVRHHDIAEGWKHWYSEKFAGLGIRASALAGLHLHFYLQTSLLAQEGDLGAFITSSEWLDVNYGKALRELLVGELGATGIHVLSPKVEAFPGTATTAAITTFKVGEREAPVRIRSVRSVGSLNGLSKGRSTPRSTLAMAPRWSILTRPAERIDPDQIELGELFRVHRGQVTGANSVWIAGEHMREIPDHLTVATVTKARDLISAGDALSSSDALRRVLDLPQELDELTPEDRRPVDRFLKWARSAGAHDGYVARNRRAWWSVGLREPAPILATYMARRAPQFTLNGCQARHINIAHGLYPREALPDHVIKKLVAWLNGGVSTDSGRTYAGGLTKFEPREMERIRIPTIEALTA